jgi:hypothetical protein
MYRIPQGVMSVGEKKREMVTNPEAPGTRARTTTYEFTGIIDTPDDL